MTNYGPGNTFYKNVKGTKLITNKKNRMENKKKLENPKPRHWARPTPPPSLAHPASPAPLSPLFFPVPSPSQPPPHGNAMGRARTSRQCAPAPCPYLLPSPSV